MKSLLLLQPSKATVAALFALASGLATAAQFIPRALEDLAAEATRIVHARVEAIEVTSGAGNAPTTRVELKVEHTWKGSPTNRIVVTQAGGTLGSRRVVIGGEATYLPGEEVVVFLVPNSRGEWLTSGMAQGKFSVRRKDSHAWVSNLFFGGSPTPGGFRPANQLPLSLEQLERRVTESKR